MKKIIVTLFFVSASLFSFAQAQFSLGIKGGPNFANIDTKTSVGENYKNRTGFHGGAFALIKLTKIGIQPEILFSQQGSTFKVNSQDFDANYNYINVPVILKLYTIAGINLQAGPQFGFVASKKNEYFDQNNIKDPIKDSDVSLALGVGWDLPFGLTIDGRYNLGLSDVDDGAGSSSRKHQVWQFSLGYKIFKFGK